MNSLLRNILKTHENLNDEDIDHGAKLLEVYSENIPFLVRLNKNNYIGKLYNDFSNDIDKMIKDRNLSPSLLKGVKNIHPLSNKIENIDKMKELCIIAMQNMIEFLKVELYPDNNIFVKGGLYDLFLKDSCADIDFPYSNFNTEIYKDCEYECGNHIRVKKIKFKKI